MRLHATHALRNGLPFMTPSSAQPDDWNASGNPETPGIPDSFDYLLDHVLRQRVSAALPAGLEQRLTAHLQLADSAATRATAGLFATADRVNTARSGRSLWTAMALHAAAFALILTVAVRHTTLLAPKQAASLAVLDVPPPPPLRPTLKAIGGGGGQAGPTPVTQGHLPKLAQEQIVPPKAPPLLQPKLAVEPSVVVQDNLKMADNKMPDLGVPNSNLKGFSMGNGSGSGIGSGSGNGVGSGSGGNTGGGPMHIGGGVRAPELVTKVDAEFSEEARKAKFSGNVLVSLWVDAQGNPTHVRVLRGVGMGLDERAVAAVREYKFRPATLNGKPVTVDLNVEVNFQIF